MLADIDTDTVDFVPNYDESTFEPTVLPTRIPNLIVNGVNGIAVGMATNIPPHNLTEVINATIALVNNPKAGLDSKCLKHVQGPDFPTGGFIYGRSSIAQAYKTGRGRFLMRAQVRPRKHHQRNSQAIIVTEIPYQVNKSKLIERIAELVNEKIIDDISDVRDETDRDGMRIVIELKRGAQPEIVLNQLYKHTQMQESFSMIFLAVLQRPAHGTAASTRPSAPSSTTASTSSAAAPSSFSARPASANTSSTATRSPSTISTPSSASSAHSGSRADARENLFQYFWGKRITSRHELAASTSTRQVRHRHELRHERRPHPTARSTPSSNCSSIASPSSPSTNSSTNSARSATTSPSTKSILASEKKLRNVIVKELEDIRDQYGDARRTQIVDESAELSLEDLIADEQVAVTVSNTGYLKRTPISIYRQQRRGGTGRIGMKTREEDFVAQLIVDSTHAYLLCFTNTGRVYWLKVYEIPDVGAAGKGKAMASPARSPARRKSRHHPPRPRPRRRRQVHPLRHPQRHRQENRAQGLLQRHGARHHRHRHRRRTTSSITADITDGKQIIFLATHDGMAIRFEEEYDPERNRGLRPMGRNAAGNKGISLKKGDYVIGAAITSSDRNARYGAR